MNKCVKRRVPKLSSPKEHYCKLEESESEFDELVRPDGLFAFPEELRGKTDWGIRKFVVFYFDDDQEYEEVVKNLSLPTRVKQHPMMDSGKLLNMIKAHKK